jgi:glucokinase
MPGRASEAVGVDVGGTKCLGVLVGADGGVVAEHRLPTPGAGPELVATVLEVVTTLLPAGPTPVGIGAPGLVDGSGTLRFAPNLPGVTELPLRQELLAALPPGSTVVIDNDSTCAAWAEHVLGVAAGADDVLLAAIGTGIGGGLINAGRLHRGANGFAGEIGHMVVDPQGPLCPCGKQGCWERYASGSGLGWMAREAAQAGVGRRVVALAGGDPEAVRGEHVTIAASAGDAEAQAVIRRFAWWLALGLANLTAILDPALIVLGGGMAESGDVLLEPTREAFAALLEGGDHRPPVPIVTARLGERAGAIGAALLARGS